MKKKDMILAIAVACSGLLFGCDVGPTTDRTPVSEASVELSYKEYKELYMNASEELKLSGYKKVEDDVETPSLIAIDKPLSFGKRSALTLTGEQNDQPTQNRILYQTDDAKRVVYVDFIYLQQNIGNDMVYLNVLPESKIDDPFFKQSMDVLLSYKNTLIKITLYMKGNDDMSKLLQESHDVQEEVVNYIL